MASFWLDCLLFPLRPVPSAWRWRELPRSTALVSFDLNYRASFWENREEELQRVFTEIASLGHIIIGNEEDYQLCFGISDLRQAAGEDQRFRFRAQEMIRRVKEKFPATVFANTLREVQSVNSHL